MFVVENADLFTPYLLVLFRPHKDLVSGLYSSTRTSIFIVFRANPLCSWCVVNHLPCGKPVHDISRIMAIWPPFVHSICLSSPPSLRVVVTRWPTTVRRQSLPQVQREMPSNFTSTSCIASEPSCGGHFYSVVSSVTFNDSTTRPAKMTDIANSSHQHSQDCHRAVMCQRHPFEQQLDRASYTKVHFC